MAQDSTFDLVQEIANFIDNYEFQNSRTHLDSEGSSSTSSDSWSRRVCQVCGDDAGQHNYYGGQSCSGCRAFFRRIVQREIQAFLTCVEGSQECKIDKTTRRRCQFCRFHRCLSIGMRPGWVLSDHERERRYQKSSSGSKAGSMVSRTSPKSGRMSLLVLTTNDNTHITAHMKMMDEHFTASMDAVCEQKQDFIKKMAVMSYFGGQSDFEFYQEFYSLCDNFVFQVMGSVPEFRSLPLQDQQELVRVNGQYMVALKYAVSLYETDWCFVYFLEKALRSGKFPYLNEFAQELDAFGMSEHKPRLMYSQVFSSPWAASAADEARHFSLVNKMQSWPRKDKLDPVDDVQMNLLKLIILFSSEFVNLQRRDIVEQAQMKFIGLLQKYMKFRYGSEAGVRLGNGLMILSYAKETIDIQKRRIRI
ncbi:hypothetical protein TCAL_06369 [Tigriopus californicus]|uniref:Nuclear receptor domain-containing protein n=1 Tax=Tigriopus californicus TaxID=6832 RepID=A0A553PH55_TIGCA|nr:thyroid hormone receptor beta-A-like [Tigriopus californicus]TRY77019.1 hypothetical protein TCAL_06369 [Tigriopus californicus]|eukprot:TCALIF_06369-PA protein Name:"Similar to thra Thyroid hormone receptor alpha (Hippoglossus hippoglossus)" AED:0.02 eAED:0.02 QI:0/-1/0/1/-1/1/1/0/418